MAAPERFGEASERFGEIVRSPDAPLDIGSVLIAVRANPGIDPDAVLARLDAIASSCPGRDTDSLCGHLFGTLGFAGNSSDYYDPANSYIDEVLERRTGIPITLSVVLIEVGRRLGLDLVGVGLPGHFMVRSRANQDDFIDAYGGGSRMDAEGCEVMLSRIEGKPVSLHPAWLAPVDNRSVLWRMLGNLKVIHAHRGDVLALDWVMQLRCLFPDAPDSERLELTRVRNNFN